MLIVYNRNSNNAPTFKFFFGSDTFGGVYLGLLLILCSGITHSNVQDIICGTGKYGFGSSMCKVGDLTPVLCFLSTIFSLYDIIYLW